MRWSGYVIATCALWCVLTFQVQAQDHFSPITGTGNNATVVLPAAVGPSIGSEPLEAGDEIGVFTPGGMCVGAVVWNGVNTVITVWGDNIITSATDGILTGEPFNFQIWRKNTNTEFANVEVTFSAEDWTYTSDGIYYISSLRAVLPALDVPVLSSPLNTSTLTDPAVGFEWEAVDYAESYQLQIGPDAAFEDTVLDVSSAATSAGPFELTTDLTYYWRVRGVNDAGAGPWSPAWSFTSVVNPPAVPELISPSAETTGAPLAVTFSWESVNGAAAYQVQLASAKDFDDIVHDVEEVSGTEYELEELQRNTTYHWRVRARNESGSGSWSEVRSFTTLGAKMSVNIKELDFGSVEIDSSATLPFVLANSDSSTAVIEGELSLNAPFRVIDETNRFALQPGESEEFSIVFEPAHAETYEEVLTIVHNADVPAGSLTISLTGSAFENELEPPQLVSPSSGAEDLPTTLTFEWERGGYASFEFQLSQEENFGEIMSAQETADTAVGVSDLEDLTTYYWRVRPILSDDDTLWSEVWSFSTILASPVLDDDVHLEYGPGRSVRVTWQAVKNAKRYQLRVAEDEEFESVVYKSDSLLEPSAEVSGLEPDTEYYWSVRAGNGKSMSQWTAPQTLIIASVTDSETEVVHEFRLGQNYPNPFNPSTTITYGLVQAGYVSLEVFDVLGRKVATLVDEIQMPGRYTVRFEEPGLATGSYIYRLISGEKMTTRRMVLTR